MGAIIYAVSFPLRGKKYFDLDRDLSFLMALVIVDAIVGGSFIVGCITFEKIPWLLSPFGIFLVGLQVGQFPTMTLTRKIRESVPVIPSGFVGLLLVLAMYYVAFQTAEIEMLSQITAGASGVLTTNCILMMIGLFR